jgi:hypothetical protein
MPANFGGMSQWSPGTSMVGDMFNAQLKSRLDTVCSDLAAYLDSSETNGPPAVGDAVSYRSTKGVADWWPAGLWHAGRGRRQNNLRYAVFPEARRLVIEDQGATMVFGGAQAQSPDLTLSFTSQDGLVRVSDLPKVAG